MSTDASALLSGITTGASATNTVGTAAMHRRVYITGVNGQSDVVALPWDAIDLNMRVVITTPGTATTSNSYTLKKTGVAADVLKISSIGSAAGLFASPTTTSASLVANPSGSTTFGSQDALSFKVSAVSQDTVTRGTVIVTYARSNGSTDGYF